MLQIENGNLEALVAEAEQRQREVWEDPDTAKLLQERQDLEQREVRLGAEFASYRQLVTEELLEHNVAGTALRKESNVLAILEKSSFENKG